MIRYVNWLGTMAEMRLLGRKQAMVNLFGNYSYLVFLAVTGIIMVPLYLHYIGAELYGGWLATGNLVNMLSILDLGLNLIFMQKLSEAYAQDKVQRFTDLLSGATTLTLMVFFASLAGGAVFAHYAPGWVKIQGAAATQLKTALMFTASGLGLSFCVLNLGAAYASLNAPLVPVAASLLGQIVWIVTTWAGLRMGHGVVALGVASALRQLIQLVIALPLFMWVLHKRSLPPLFPRWRRMREYLHACLPTMSGRWLGFLANNCQEFVIGAMFSMEATVLFSITRRLPDLCGSLFGPFGSSVYPTLSAAAGEDWQPRVAIVRKVLSISSFMMAWVLGACVLVNHWFIGMWVGPQFYGGPWLNIAICVSTFIISRYGIMNFICLSQGFFAITAFCEILNSVAQLLLLLTLVAWLGPIGLPLGRSVPLVAGVVYLLPRILRSRLGPHPTVMREGLGSSVAIFSAACILSAGLSPQWSFFAAVVFAGILPFTSANGRSALRQIMERCAALGRRFKS